MIRKIHMPEMKDAIRELIGTGKRFFIAIDPVHDEPALFAASAFKKILELAGKETFFWPMIPETLAEKYKFILPISSYPPLPRKIKIRIPKTVALEEMRYDDEPDAISIVISPKSHLDIKDLLIERAPYEMDGAFCFMNDESVLEKMDAPVARPPREKTVFLARNDRTLAEKICEIREGIPDIPPLDAGTATLILASLFAETEELHTARGAPLYRLTSSLLECGADAPTVRRVLSRPATVAEAQLLGRALARTTLDAPLQTSWTFLAAADFEKTRSTPTPDLLASLLRKIYSNIERPRFSVLCYEHGGVRAVIAARDQALLSPLARRAGAAKPDANGFVRLDSPFPTFSETETKIRQLLKENTDVTIQL